MPERFDGRPEGIGSRHIDSVSVQEHERGTADGTGVGLRVEPAVGGIFILLPAIRTEGKAGHGGIDPVIGNRLDDRQPGAAVGAVDEGVAVSAVRRVESSLRQSLQMAMSGEICTSLFRPFSLAMIRKLLSF